MNNPYPPQGPRGGPGEKSGSNTLIIVIVIILIILLGFGIGYAIYKAKNASGSTGCTGTSDCPGTQVCVNNVCVVSGPTGCTGTSTNNNCPSSTPFCINEICLGEPTSCSGPSGCYDPAFPICQNNTCIARCNDKTNPCSGSLVCFQGICSLCTANSQCKGINQTCVIPSGATGGICQDGGGFTGAQGCCTNSDCSGGLVCIPGPTGSFNPNLQCNKNTNPEGTCGPCSNENQCTEPNTICDISLPTPLCEPVTAPATYTYSSTAGPDGTPGWVGYFELFWINCTNGCQYTLISPIGVFDSNVAVYNNNDTCGFASTCSDSSAVFSNSLGYIPAPGNSIFAGCSTEVGSSCSGSNTSSKTLPQEFSKITIDETALTITIE